MKLLDSDLVCAAVAGKTTRGLKNFVHVKWLTIFNWNCAWIFATCSTIAKADRSGKFTIFYCRMGTIQPAWPVCTTSVCWHARCWQFLFLRLADSFCFSLCYEPWVLTQEALRWQLFILTPWNSLHSSMSSIERPQLRNMVKICNEQVKTELYLVLCILLISAM